METYVIPILIFSGIGLIAGILLHVASKTFEVKVDEKIEQINEALPQMLAVQIMQMLLQKMMYPQTFVSQAEMKLPEKLAKYLARML
jgi:hypothetical protein